MDTLLNLQALPLGAAIGGPAIAIGGITLFFIRKYVNGRTRSSSGHPPPLQVPGLPSTATKREEATQDIHQMVLETWSYKFYQDWLEQYDCSQLH